LRDRKLFPLVDKAVAVNLLRVLQPLGGVVLFGLRLKLPLNVVLLRLLERLDKTLGSLAVLTHLKEPVLQ
jgi:hypothetical protein